MEELLWYEGRLQRFFHQCDSMSVGSAVVVHSRSSCCAERDTFVFECGLVTTGHAGAGLQLQERVMTVGIWKIYISGDSTGESTAFQRETNTGELRACAHFEGIMSGRG